MCASASNYCHLWHRLLIESQFPKTNLDAVNPATTFTEAKTPLVGNLAIAIGFQTHLFQIIQKNYSFPLMTASPRSFTTGCLQNPALKAMTFCSSPTTILFLCLIWISRLNRK